MLVQQMVNGVLLGCTYSLIALAFSLLVGVLNILNMALGQTFMLGAFGGLFLLNDLGVPFIPALILAMLWGGLVSLVVYVLSFKFVRPGYFIAPVLSTLGVGIMAETVATRVWGAADRKFADYLPQVDFSVGDVTITFTQAAIVGTSLMVMLILSYVVLKTKVGRAMRAIAENPTTAALLGVEVGQIVVISFFVGGMLSGASGVLVGLVFHSISPFMGFNATLKGLVVMVLGGLGNLVGAAIGGIIIGLIETLSVAYWSASYRDALVYGVLILVLLVRPQGLLGVRTHEERI
jgi:branched-chain amino acid transport system permease protein